MIPTIKYCNYPSTPQRAEKNSELSSDAWVLESNFKKLSMASDNKANMTEGAIVSGLEVWEDKTKSFIENLESTIENLKSDINRWEHREKILYSRRDLELMPKMVQVNNDQHPDLNLKFSKNPETLKEIVDSIKNEKYTSFRIIVNRGAEGHIHFSVIDGRVINGKTSLILFEPVEMKNIFASNLASKSAETLLSEICDVHFCAAEMNIQKSFAECGIFSLDIAKKLQIKFNELSKMHEDNINGLLQKNTTEHNKKYYLPYKHTDTYLPADFYTYTQSESRLKSYADVNKYQGKIALKYFNNTSKQLKTLRQDLNTGEFKMTMEDKRVSVEAYIGRISEYTTVLKYLKKNPNILKAENDYVIVDSFNKTFL